MENGPTGREWGSLTREVEEIRHDLRNMKMVVDAQSEMIRDDRVHIVAGQRRSDQALNMRLQKETRAANEALDGGKTRIITTIESPQVAIYGNVAVASYVQAYNNFPHNQRPVPGQPVWVTLVLVKDDGDWGIAHAHVSPTAGN